MPVPDRDLAARPRVCPRGHPLGPGQLSYSFAVCPDCPGNGHHYLICVACGARIWLGHPGAVWTERDGTPI